MAELVEASAGRCKGDDTRELEGSQYSQHHWHRIISYLGGCCPGRYPFIYLAWCSTGDDFFTLSQAVSTTGWDNSDATCVQALSATDPGWPITSLVTEIIKENLPQEYFGEALKEVALESKTRDGSKIKSRYCQFPHKEDHFMLHPLLYLPNLRLSASYQSTYSWSSASVNYYTERILPSTSTRMSRYRMKIPFAFLTQSVRHSLHTSSSTPPVLIFGCWMCSIWTLWRVDRMQGLYVITRRSDALTFSTPSRTVMPNYYRCTSLSAVWPAKSCSVTLPLLSPVKTSFRWEHFNSLMLNSYYFYWNFRFRDMPGYPARFYILQIEFLHNLSAFNCL